MIRKATKRQTSPRTKSKVTKPEADKRPLLEDVTEISDSPPEAEAIAPPGVEEVVEKLEFPVRQQVSLGFITLNAGTQSRKAIHEPTVDDYAEAMEEGRWQWEREPLPILFSDGENYYPGDGHHRIVAADKAGFDTILAEVRPGT